MAPTLAELQELADRAIAELGDGQALAVWDRAGGLRVTLTAVAAGRGGEAIARSAEELPRAAKAARLRAQQARAWPVPALAQPESGRAHDGFDPRMITAQPGRQQRDGLTIATEPGATRIAVASSTGVRAAEERSQNLLRVSGAVNGRSVEVVRAGTGEIDPVEAVGEALALLEAGAGGPPPQAGSVVLGHQAVAALLDPLRSAFGVHLALHGGPIAGRLGTQVAAPSISLSDSALYPGTLPRSFDVEGVPRKPVPLIQDGVAHRPVLDTAAAHAIGETSTGHATRAGALAPRPEHLVLVGGGAEDIAALAASVDYGLYIPALRRDDEGRPMTRGAIRIRSGGLTVGVDDRRLEIDTLAALAGVEALSARQQLVPILSSSPGGIGAAIVPALHTRAGVRW